MLGMSAYSVYKGKKPGEKVADDLIVPEVRGPCFIICSKFDNTH